MSTKTNFKRVALVAVASLGLGVLTSVAPANAVLAGTVAANTLYISATAGTSGEGSANQTLTSANSSGFVSKTSTNGTAASGGYTLTGSIAGTAVVLAGAQIAFAVGSSTAAADGVSVVVTGGTLVSLSAQNVEGSIVTSITPSVNGSSTTAVALAAGTSSAALIGRFKVSAAAGTTATITAYTGTGVDDTDTASNGAMIGTWTLTVATASSSGAYNAANSTISTQIPYVKGTTASGLLAYDNTSRIANGSVGAIYVALADLFTAPITTGILTATATNGAFVNINDGAPTAGHDYAATTAFDSETGLAGGDAYISVTQPVANTAGTTTVTITLDGAVLATKTLNWNGDAASISVDTVNSASSFKNGYDAYAAYAGVVGSDFLNMNIIYVVKDAAGNVLDLPASAPTVSGATGSMVGASLAAGGDVTGTAALAYGDQEKQFQVAAVGYGVATMLIPVSTLQGAGTYKLKFVNGSGTSLYTPAISATVSRGGLNSFTAKWNKDSYSPGDIAVLTVTGKDVYGNTIADGTGAAGLSASVSGSTSVGFIILGTACDATYQGFAGGVFTCKYAANTEGSWSYSVDMTTATAQSATVGSLKITSGGGVSNADVLKAIVSLIASINKQIAALQKALLKK